ncbi:MAG: hypothetical protein K2N05_00660 [Muribaculaceae bacterium]|nr:hypothetical protein [Muribaculaceae bacterium]
MKNNKGLRLLPAVVIVIFCMMGMADGVKTQGQTVEDPENPDLEPAIEIVAGDSTDSIANRSVEKTGISRPNRKVTPVDIDDDKPPVVLHYYDKHGDPLDEPVLFLATLDTVVKPKSKPIYPLYNGLSLGFNFADAITMAAGQSYGSFDVWADVSLHNWIFPVMEIGLGIANSSPENSNFTYKTKPSFYTKIGINYNFLYKSNPDYQCFLGLRAGYSYFRYDVNDITVDNDYWGEQQKLNLTGLSGHSFYGEALAGIKVKIVDRFSLGWSLRYHFKFKTTSNSSSQPWFIPGYGASSPISFSLSAIYTLPGPGKNNVEETSKGEPRH